MSHINILKKAIDVPLMDINNISKMILTYNQTTFFLFRIEWSLLNGIPHDIKALILASTKEEAFDMLKEKLDSLDDYDFGKKVNHFNKLSINNFDIQELQFKESINYTSFSIPRIEHLIILQGYHDSDLEFIFYQYKYRCKQSNKWIKKYEDRRDYYSSFYYSNHIEDSDIDALPYIKTLF